MKSMTGPGGVTGELAKPQCPGKYSKGSFSAVEPMHWSQEQVGQGFFLGSAAKKVV